MTPKRSNDFSYEIQWFQSRRDVMILVRNVISSGLKFLYVIFFDLSIPSGLDSRKVIIKSKCLHPSVPGFG